jgi:hypothetical protein
MKKIILNFATVLFLLIACSYQVAYTAKNNTAETLQLEGLYIFTDCTPVQQYLTLGTVKSSGAFSGGEYAEIKARLIKKAKKEYPTATGIIIHMASGEVDKADCIKFK